MPKLNWKTLSEIEKEYKVTANALRKYIHEEKIGKYYLKREGRKWYISELYIKSNYEKR